jgi:spore protease
MNGNVVAPHTDLAVEAREMVSGKVDSSLAGVAMDTTEEEEVLVSRVHISSPEAARVIGKAQGDYITIEAAGLRDNDTLLHEKVMKLLAREINKLAKLPRDATVLIVGLGNWDVTPDALGPRTVEKVVVTRHLQDMLSPELRGGVRAVCAIAPGVLGTTGMETVEIIQGITAKIRPDLVIAIDALAAASSRRVVTTVQLANTGIHPGSGVGNKRFGLTAEALGVPVLAVGVPTVVHASMIAVDTLEILRQQKAFVPFFQDFDARGPEEQELLFREVLPNAFGDLMVTPKDVDRLIDDMADIVAGGINQAMHPNIDYHNIHKYLH